jgi:hypothetical protein
MVIALAALNTLGTPIALLGAVASSFRLLDLAIHLFCR